MFHSTAVQASCQPGVNGFAEWFLATALSQSGAKQPNNESARSFLTYWLSSQGRPCRTLYLQSQNTCYWKEEKVVLA